MMMNEKVLNFDMDGTLCNFYGVEGWLDDLMASNPRPYRVAKPRFNFSSFARLIHRLQRLGYQINIISWLAKCNDDDFHKVVADVKVEWLQKHLPSVKFDNIIIVPYGTPKQTLANGILFDDEKPNRDNWQGKAYDVDDILNILRGLS